jgi:hypothetical protein
VLAQRQPQEQETSTGSEWKKVEHQFWYLLFLVVYSSTG